MVAVLAPAPVLSQTVRAATQPPGGEPPGAVTLRDGVVVDAAAGRAFVPSRDGGVEAIDLASGQPRWATDEAAKPLFAASGTLLAQRTPTEQGSLALALVDAGSGRIRTETSVAIEPGLWASVEDRPASVFRSSATADAVGGVVLAWSHTSAPEGGALRGYLPSEQEGLAPTLDGDEQRLGAGQRGEIVERSGAVRVDLATGAVTTPGARLRSAAAGAVRAGTVRAGTFLPDVDGRQLRSADGRHVLVSQRIEQPADPWSVYRWSIYERTGDLVGSFESAISMSPFVVDRDGVVFVHPPGLVNTAEGLVEQPLSLQKVDARSGTRLWARSIRELEYRGPMAP